MAALGFESEGGRQRLAELLRQLHQELCEKQARAVEAQLESHRAALLQGFDQRFSLLEKQVMGHVPSNGFEMDYGKSGTFVEAEGTGKSGTLVEAQNSRPESELARVMSSTKTARKHSSFIKTLEKTSDISGHPQNGYQWCKRKWCRWHGTFDLCMGVVVVFNVALIFAQLQDPGRDHTYITICEHILNVIYIAELTLRITFEGYDFFTVMNVADAFVVVLTCLDFYVLTSLLGASGIFRLLKILRIGKTLRVIRTMAMFRHLRVLLRTIASSFMSLFWSMMVLGLCQLTGGLMLCQLVQPWVEDPANDPVMREWVLQKYGTSSKAVYTLFEVTFSGGWIGYSRPLIEEIHPGFAVFFIVYITCVNFSIIRIISALFLKETLHSAESDADMRIQQSQQEGREFMARLRDLFLEADLNHTSQITFSEFDRLISYPKVQAWFLSIGVDVREGKAIFDLLDENGSGELTFEEFARGIVKQKGVARSQDFAKFARATDRLTAVACETRRLCRQIAAERAQQAPEPPCLKGETVTV